MTQDIDGLLERIAAIRPILERNARQTEDDRRVVDENIEALKEAGAFKIMVPKRYGGWQQTFARTSTSRAKSRRDAVRRLGSRR